LGEISQVQSGVGFPKHLQGRSLGDYPFAKVVDIANAVKENHGVIEKAKNYLNDSELKVVGAKPFPEGTTLFAKIGEALRLNRRAINSLPILADNNVMGLIPDLHRISPRYLYYFTHTIDLSEYSQATTVPSVRKSDIVQIPIPLPPLAEQERIVARIEELFTQLDAGTAALKHVQVGLKRYKSSVLKAAFEGKLVSTEVSNEKATELMERVLGKEFERINEQVNSEKLSNIPLGWAFGKLENLIYIAGRIGWRGLKAEEYMPEGPLLLSVYNLNKGDLVDFCDVQHISQARYDESPEIILRENDILLAKDGAGIGKIGLVKELPGPATVNSSLLVIRASEIFIPKFLFYLLMGPKMQRIVRERISGSATPHLFQRDIKRFTLLIPPLSEQQHIVEEIDRRFSFVTEVEIIVSQNLKHISQLRQSILKSAFSGKLIL
jgi:type I restriction enzyme S subunit